MGLPGIVLPSICCLFLMQVSWLGLKTLFIKSFPISAGSWIHRMSIIVYSDLFDNKIGEWYFSGSMWTNAGARKGAWQGPSWKTSFWKRSKLGTHSYNFNLIPSSITTTSTMTMTTRRSLARTRRRSLMNSVLRRVKGDWGSSWTGYNISLM